MRFPLFILPTAIMAFAGCIIPDTGIKVYSTQECGHQFTASTNWAWGLTGNGKKKYIFIDDDPIMKKWCLSPDENKLMELPQSWIYQQILDDIVKTCEARAVEMELGAENCSAMASIAYSGHCPGELAWCENEDGNDEVGPPDLPP